MELDYSSFHPKMIHDLAEIEMTNDPYVGIGNLDRAHGKSMFNMMINAVGEYEAASKDKAIRACMNEYQGENMTRDEANAAIDAVLERYEPISKQFFTGIGLKLMFYDSQIANNVMLRAIDEFKTIILTVYDSFICIMEFEENLRQLMAEEYIAIMKPELSPGIDMKHSDYYLTDIDKLNIAEYGTPDGFDIPMDPKQELRKQALEKQAYAARKNYGIIFEDVCTEEGREQKYAPQDADDI